MDRPFYSITINGKNTWDEWKLMPVKAGKIDFAPPELRYEVADVAGSDDPLDFTEALTGYPLYKSRRGSIRFRFFDNGTSARNRFDDIKNFLHGKKCKVVIEDQPEYYYEGRMMVEELKFSKYGNWAEFDLSYILNAYKMEIGSSDEDWLWDPFNFETGIIREYGNVLTEGQTVFLEREIAKWKEIAKTEQNEQEETKEEAYQTDASEEIGSGFLIRNGEKYRQTMQEALNKQRKIEQNDIKEWLYGS